MSQISLCHFYSHFQSLLVLVLVCVSVLWVAYKLMLGLIMCLFSTLIFEGQFVFKQLLWVSDEKEQEIQI